MPAPSTALRSVSPISTTLRRVPASVLVHDVRSGGVSSDSALPLVGSLRGQAAGRNIYMGPVLTVAHDSFLAPCTFVPTATVPRVLLSGAHLLYKHGVAPLGYARWVRRCLRRFATYHHTGARPA